MKHLLKMLDMSQEEIIDILNLADQLKYELKHGIPHPMLKGKSLGMIFQKASTRTRVSFETGMYQLGGHALFLSADDLQIGRGEPVEDTARVLSRYIDGIMIRTFAQKEVEDLAEYGSIPIINGLTDLSHPCQVLADLMTIREFKGSFDGLKMCYIGDGNNMANSLIVGGLKVGMQVSVACPEATGRIPWLWTLHRRIRLLHYRCAPGGCQGRRYPADGCVGIHGAGGRDRKAPHCLCRVPDQRRDHGAAKPDAMVMHCLPAHRRRRSLPRSLRNTPRRSLRRRKTGSTPRRRSWFA